MICDPDSAARTPAADHMTDDTDCDDADPFNHPGGEEVCDEQDNNCDGEIDEGTLTTFYADTDGDDWGDLSVTTEPADNPPATPISPATATPTTPPSTLVHPVCDGIEDCDGTIDNGVLSTFYGDADNDVLEMLPWSSRPAPCRVDTAQRQRLRRHRRRQPRH